MSTFIRLSAIGGRMQGYTIVSGPRAKVSALVAHHDFHAAVHLPAALTPVVRDRIGLAEALRDHARGLDAAAHERRLHGSRTPLRKLHVVVLGTDGVRITFYEKL